jgi:uncharacterized protein (TIGR00266 family)
MEYKISGEIAQTARIQLSQGDTLWAGRGSLMAYSRGVQWNLRVPGGLSGAIRRSFAGEGVALTHIEAQQPDQYVMLAANEPGHIATWDLADGAVVTTRGAFLAAWGPNIEIDVTVARRAGAAFFGGAGLFLQRVSGAGLVLIHGSGDFCDHRLAQGEQLLVSTGNLAAFGDNVDYDIQGVGGCRKMVFGGEGLFMTRLSGPGRVLLQTLKRQHGKQATAATTG